MTTDKKRGVQLPWGLSADNLTPGSMKTISAEKLKAFSVGNMNAVKQKSSVLKKKEEQEEKKKLEEEKQAQVYQDFVREFENDAPKTKTFISSGIINADKNQTVARASDKGRLYNPTGLKKLEEMNKQYTQSTLAPPATSNKKPEKPKKKQKEAEKKKSNLELFKDELKQQQAEREERHRLKKLGIIPMTAPDVLEGNFEPGMNMKDQIMGDFIKTGNNGAGGVSNIYWDGSTYVDDPNSTNLYVGNISISVNEDKLCKMFGAFGPLASVKIMWPRNEEERRRDRNCGFVAFMVREHAEKALDDLNEKEIGGYPLRIGWGKSVPIPPHPVYVPPHMMAAGNVPIPPHPVYVPPHMMAAGNVPIPPHPVYVPPHMMAAGAAMIRPALTGLPFNAQPRKISIKAPIQLPPNQHDANELLRECIVYVLIPHDKVRLALINRMIEFVVVEGPMFEAMIMNREINNPAFAFLFDNKCPEHIYYRWRLFSLLQGESSIKWRTEEFRMFKNGSMWKPPPNAAEEEKKEEKKEEPAKKGQLSNSQRDKLEDMLRGLTIERNRVGECMHWCLQHADAAEEAARLFLCNDLLYNSCAEVPNASFYRTKLECKLAGIVINLKATYEEIKTHAAREKFKSQVMGCLRAWREWNVYSGEFLLQLDIIFIGGKDEEPSPDDVMDGMPLDVDGVPLAKEDDSDVDGAPMDVDGVPLVVPRPRKSKFDDDDIFTKSSTPPPNLGSKWETSNWEKTEEKASAVKRNEPVYTPKEESDEKRKKKREIEVKVAEYVDKLESGKCTRIKEITTTDQAEIYRYLLLKGRDAKKSIKQIATGKITLQSIQLEMKQAPCTSPILSERDRKHSKKRSKNNSMSALVASYGSSGPSRSPSPEPSKRKREEKKRRSNSPKHEKKKKSRH